MASVNPSARYLARYSANPVVLTAALTAGYLDEVVAANVNLPESMWWDLYSRKKIPAPVASNLCNRKDLTVKQLEHVYRKERRITVRETALQNNGVPDELTDVVLEAAWLTPQAARAWLYSAVIAPRALTQVAKLSGKPEMGFWVVNKNPESYSDAVVVDMLFDAYRDEFRLFPLPLQVLTTFDQRPGLARMVLERISTEGVVLAHRPLLTAAAECRWQTPEVRALLTETVHRLRDLAEDDKPGAWNVRLVNDVVKALWGHPNTPIERLEEFAGFFTASAEKNVTGDTTMKTLRRLREACGDAVTGDWSSDLPAAQTQTLVTLAAKGLVRNPVMWHPRASAALSGHAVQKPQPKYASAEDAWAQCEHDGAATIASTWALSSDWPIGLGPRAAKYLEVELADAPESVWETVFSLIPNWAPSAAELAVAARALDE